MGSETHKVKDRMKMLGSYDRPNDLDISGTFTKKLELFGPLNDNDKDIIKNMVTEHHQINRNDKIILEGDVVTHIFLILHGTACRYKTLRNGRRQIIGFIFPGEFCMPHRLLFEKIDYSVSALCATTAISISRNYFNGLLSRPAIAKSINCNNIIDDAILREWLLNIGQRNSVERTAHLLCEIYFRVMTEADSPSGGAVMPRITQTDFADAIALSTIHTNKTLHTFEAADLAFLKSGYLVIKDMRALMQKAGFAADYLVGCRQSLPDSFKDLGSHVLSDAVKSSHPNEEKCSLPNVVLGTHRRRKFQ